MNKRKKVAGYAVGMLLLLHAGFIKAMGSDEESTRDQSQRQQPHGFMEPVPTGCGASFHETGGGYSDGEQQQQLSRGIYNHDGGYGSGSDGSFVSASSVPYPSAITSSGGSYNAGQSYQPQASQSWFPVESPLWNPTGFSSLRNSWNPVPSYNSTIDPDPILSNRRPIRCRTWYPIAAAFIAFISWRLLFGKKKESPKHYRPRPLPRQPHRR